MTRVRTGTRLLLVAVLVGSTAASTAPVSLAAVEPPYPGALPDTASATTIAGRGDDFSGLTVHANQTEDLTTQAVSLTWNWAGRATDQNTTASQRYNYLGDYGWGTNYLQIMQCWGEAVTTADTPVDAANYVPGNLGPAREHCEFGGLQTGDSGTQGVPGVLAQATYTRSATRATTAADAKEYGDETAYPAQASNAPPDIPFVAADGSTVPHPIESSVYKNPYFNRLSTNESAANYVYPNGRGGVSFQVQNSRDSRGLGCGAAKTGGAGLNKCWLVIVPRGSEDLNGTPLTPRSASNRLSTFASPLSSTVWKNRLAIPLDFRPVQTACTPGQQSFETLGSSLVSNAVLSWQAKLCGTAGTTFNYTQGTDSRSRDALASGTDSLQFMSDPPPPSSATTPATFAPVTLSGLGIAFTWDLQKNNVDGSTNVGPPLGEVKLNQRLVAKLLTQSYISANTYRISNANSNKPDFDAYRPWLGDFDKPKAHLNPAWIGVDPEFLALNPDIAAQLAKRETLHQTSQTGAAYLQGPLFGGDAIAKLWSWLTSDQEARAFLAGSPDPWGMQVDPYFSTSADVNPTGFAFDPAISEVPYPDPWQGRVSSQNCDGLPLLAMTDILPAARDLNTVARDVQAVDYLEKYQGGSNCDPSLGPIAWKRNPTGLPAVQGTRQILGITDTASGAQYGVTFASLKNADGKYVAPNTTSIAAAAQHLTDTDVPGVQQPDLQTGSDKADPDAYPLTLVTYAGVTTDGMSTAECGAYATFLDYAAGDGQSQGTAVGQLPLGYVPLPAALRQQTTLAAKTVAQCAQEPAPPAEPAVLDSGSTAPDTSVSEGSQAAVGPAAVEPAAAAPVAAAPGVSLASRSTTKPDPSAFVYIVPIAVVVGLLALLAAPLAGMRRRRSDAPPGAGAAT